ncbi:LysR family transcriptional regulator [Bradyrhizobium prioriisuperbiae]|uniref:LysR family transcriptional regulator n=1 Tax=Bradyrhizobium prioriisuperbiae TaxID=2854389 RepID=UPI0028E6FE5A|nr:LysR family transcriptional regulator [Bradyrhizobium prioritasuperba]
MATILEKTAGLLAFVRTVDAGSFAGAAKLIGASPSAVSKSVARLEQRLGVRLLQRSTRTLSPTSEGAAYYERVAPHLRAIEEAEDIVQIPGNVRGVLRVCVPTTFGRPLISAWSGSFLERYPDIKLDLSVTDRRVDLIREGFDLAVRIGDLEDTNLVGRSLGVLQYVLGASPDYLQRRGIPRTIDDLKQHACLGHLLAGRPQPFTFADGTRILPAGPFDSDDAQSLIEAVLKGVGITQFMRLAIEGDLATGRLNVVLPEIPMFTTPIYVLHAFERQLPLRARLFIDFLVEALGVDSN